MLPSPGFSIPSIGTPVHQPEEDQQIMQMPPLQPQGLTMSTSSLPTQQSMNKIYQTNNMGYATPHSMMHSQTPVLSYFKYIFISYLIQFVCVGTSKYAIIDIYKYIIFSYTSYTDNTKPSNTCSNDTNDASFGRSWNRSSTTVYNFVLFLSITILKYI